MTDVLGDSKAALVHELSERAAPDDLERPGILKPSGTISDARIALDRDLTKALVNRQMAQRPDYNDLVHANIAYDATLAPSLQGPARALDLRLRSDQLNAALQRRPPPDLVPSLMPADNVAPRLRSAQIALEQAFVRDQLKHKLSSRPPADALLKANILKAAPSVAPSLQATQVELDKQLRVDRLNEFLARRDPALVDDGAVAASLQGARRDLQRSLARSNLYHALQQRPSPEQVRHAGLLLDAPVDHVQIGGESPSFGERARTFVLTRTLFKMAVVLGEHGLVSAAQKGLLKDLIVDQDPAVLAAADLYDGDGDLDEFQDTLVRLSYRR